MKKQKECLYYEKLSSKIVKCILCPHECEIQDGHTGICKVRKNSDGKLYSLNYGVISDYALEPIEKKPLKNYYPGSKIFSIGSTGCNLKCIYCQNHEIVQGKLVAFETTAHNIVDISANEKDNLGIAFTFNEPVVGYEFVLETAKLNHEKGKKNILVTNGYINEAPLRGLLKYIDALNIDLKGFDDDFYRKNCGAHVEPVKRTIEIAAEKAHVEITTLLITGLNDQLEMVESIAKWIAEISPKIPLHLSRYFPCYQYNAPPTDLEFMKKAKEIADRYLAYVYLGNV